MITDNAVQELVESLKPTPQDTNNTYSAVVSRVDDENVVWVNLVGSNKETPTASASSEVKSGDVVTVEWRNNRLYIVGNNSNPSAGVVRVANVEAAANMAREAANSAVMDAGRAREAADLAVETAKSVEGIATRAEGYATEAKKSADTAFTNLSQVQAVLEVAQWIATHGTYTKATIFNPNTTYYTLTATQVADPSDEDKDSDGVLIYYELSNGVYVRTTDTEVDSQKTYYTVTGTPVAGAKAEDIAQYYTLAVTDAMANYIKSHLALTDDGLYVMADNSHWKVRIADDGVYIIDDTNGQNKTVAKYKDVITLGEIATGNYVVIDDDSFDIKHGTTDIAHFGYGEGQAQSGTAEAPYYTLGTRASGSTVGNYSVAEGLNVTATGYGSHAEGENTVAQSGCAHAEGRGTVARKAYSHAEGDTTTAKEESSHAEGSLTTASGIGSHAEGRSSHTNTSRTEGIVASGDGAHAEGWAASSGSGNIIASGDGAHAEGYAEGHGHIVASGKGSHAQNCNTKAGYDYQTAMGKYNDNQSDNALEIGNGTDSNNRSNAFVVDWDGNVDASGDVTDGNGNVLSNMVAKSILLDFCHPVGTYYYTDDADFDPNDSWGGTWSLLGEGQVLLSGSASGSYRVGTQYGGNTKSYTPAGSVGNHTLNVSEIPSHTHGVGTDNRFVVTNKAINLWLTGKRAYTASSSSGFAYMGTDGSTGAVGEWENMTSTGGGGAHNHGFTGTATSIDVMQSSTAVYIWHRTA